MSKFLHQVPVYTLCKSQMYPCHPLDNSHQTTRPRSSDAVVDKRTKNYLDDVKFWVYILSGSFGLVVFKRMRKWFEDQGRVGQGELSRGQVVQIPGTMHNLSFA